jgi:2-dehydropantoate 2-reductase
MRFVVVGAGAVGGVVGARLAQAGHEVVLVARGPHFEAIRDHGLRVRSAGGEVTISAPVVDAPGRVDYAAGDVVLLAVKSNDTVAALDDIAGAAPPNTAIVCLQNGVANEREALRRFPNVYGVPVVCPTTHLEPGVVQALCAPVEGILDVGRYPGGVDEGAAAVSGAFSDGPFLSEARSDILPWKYAKLLMNLGNAVDALCSPDDRNGAKRLIDLARQEGRACLAAAGIHVAKRDPRRDRLLRTATAEDRAARPGGSSWQSLARGTGAIEADYLNGEIVLLGRLHGVPTPVNALLQRVAKRHAAARRPPRSIPASELLGQL